MAAGGILAIDASPCCGWAYGTLGARPVWGHWDLGKIDQPGLMYCRLFDGLHDAIKFHRPSQIVYEAPFTPAANVKAKTKAETAFALIQLCGMIEFTACRYDVRCSFQEVQQARRKVLGKNPTGGPEKVKPAIVDWAKRRGWDVALHDEADALVLLQHAVVVADRTGNAHYLRHGETL